jgi:signal transduction histidine kinase
MEISMHRNGDWITLSVVDHGRGFHVGDDADPVACANTIGLASIRERALMLDGTCTIRSALGRGTTHRSGIHSDHA